MNRGTFYENFELLAEAPNSVQKLREMILQLAVQGKIVLQDPDDEPASRLLEKIGVENERLIDEKNIKKSKPLPLNGASDLPFELPVHWEWTKLNTICYKITDGAHHTPNYIATGVPFLSVKDISSGSIILSDTRFISQEQHEELIKRCNPEYGDILLTKVGTTGIAKVIDVNIEFSIFVSLALLKFPKDFISAHFLELLINAPLVKEQSSNNTQGIGNKNLVLKHIKNFDVPLPPLNEQKRIVTKVDQLMALCDQLEASQQKKHTKRILLNNAALDKLLTAPTPEEFAQHWQRICDNFDLLYDAPETVGQLRQAILQLAVQGKLVSQYPGDEPAAVLLEKITAEKERLIKEGKIRKPKPLSSNDVENPYDLPLNWKWTRLFDIGLINPRNQAKDDMATSFIPMTLISETYSIPISSERRLWGEIKSGFTHFAEEDVVLAKITPCFQNGKSAVMRNLLNGLGAGTTELHVFRPLLDGSVNPDYVLLYLRSPQFLREGIDRMTGTAGQKRVPRDYFAGNSFPLPPFEEQKRIVAKVDQLMALCDELEAGLVQAQTDGGKLMEAVVHHVLAG